jgi:acyl dehydratase
MRYWEDFSVGEVIEYGSYEVKTEEMVAFARQYDPQPFHLSDAVTPDNPDGLLVASGWFTVGLMMRMLADNILSHTVSQGAPGMDRLRWTKPVKAGDRLHMRTTILEKRASRSRPAIGLLTNRHEVLDQDNAIVMWCEGVGMFGRRPAQEAAS